MFLWMVYTLFACSEAHHEMMSAADTGLSESDTTESPADTGLQGEPSTPAWWSLRGQLDLVNGVPQPGSTFTLAILSSDGEPLCDEPLDIRLLSAVDAKPPHSTVLSWWNLELMSARTVCDVDVPLAGRLQVGVGSMHPDILAALSRVDGIEPSQPLNGAYLMFDDAPESLLVFGVAGLPEQYSGKGSEAQQAPLADGAWQIEPVYLFRY